MLARQHTREGRDESGVNGRVPASLLVLATPESTRGGVSWGGGEVFLGVGRQ